MTIQPCPAVTPLLSIPRAGDACRALLRLLPQAGIPDTAAEVSKRAATARGLGVGGLCLAPAATKPLVIPKGACSKPQDGKPRCLDANRLRNYWGARQGRRRGGSEQKT